MTALRTQAHAQLDLIPEEKVEQVINFMVTFTEEKKTQPDASIKIGVGKGKFKAPENFDVNNDEIAAMLERYALS